ncbi:MAG: SGNH/GDSL hydrolase family protein [Planctomycetota bacterium]
MNETNPSPLNAKAEPPGAPAPTAGAEPDPATDPATPPASQQQPRRARRRRLRIVVAVATALLSLLLATIALEVYLRVRYRRKLPNPGCYVFDLDLGKRLKRGFVGQSYGVDVSINSLGLRERELTKERPPGAKRILALGDSWTFGISVETDETWPKQLEQELGGPEKIEVVNAGISGYETHHEAFFYEHDLAPALDHDVLLIGFYPVNDTHDKSHRYRRYRWLHDLHPKLLDLYLLPKQLMITQVYKNWKVNRKLQGYLERYHPENRDEDDDDAPDWSDAFREEDHGWQTCAESLLKLGKLSREHGAKGIVVLFPDVRDIKKYIEDQHPRVLPLVKKATEAAGMELIDLVDAFRPYAGKEIELVVQWGATHVDERGYALIGRALAAALRERGLLGLQPGKPQ